MEWLRDRHALIYWDQKGLTGRALYRGWRCAGRGQPPTSSTKLIPDIPSDFFDAAPDAKHGVVPMLPPGVATDQPAHVTFMLNSADGLSFESILQNSTPR